MRKFLIGALTIALILSLSTMSFAIYPGVKADWSDDDLRFYERSTGSGAQIHFGVDDSGLDIKFFAETSGDYLLWDESADALLGVGIDVTLDDGDLTLQDSDHLYFGDADDVDMHWDATDFHINPLADDQILNFGVAAATQLSWDLRWYANTSLQTVIFDAGAAKVTFEDVDLYMNDNDSIYFGDAGAEGRLYSDGSDVVFYGDVLNISGDVTHAGHVDSREFTVNAFQYPAGGTDWTHQVEGAHLAQNKASKKVWLPLNFLKIGDEIVSYKLVGDAVETTALTLDCKLVKVNKADPLTTTDVGGGGITQVDADGNFDSEATLSAVETVATDCQYTLEIEGTTTTSDTITVIGAEVKINRKL